MKEKSDLEFLMYHWYTWHRSDRQLRFGQYLINNNYISGPMPDLFYEEDENIAFGKVCMIKGI